MFTAFSGHLLVVRQQINLLYLFFVAFISVLPWLQGVADTISAFFSTSSDNAIAQKDYVNYWLGGIFAVNGNTSDLYNFQIYFSRMQEIFGNNIEVRAWSYPPHTLLFLWPLGYFSYKISIIAFYSFGLLIYILAAGRFLKKYGDAEFSLIFWFAQLPFIAVVFFTMQNGFYIAALFLFGILFMHEKPALAGLYFAIMTVKPQLGIFIPFLLMFVGAWRTMFWASLFTIILVALSALIFGISDWQDYISLTIPYQSSVLHNWNGFFLEIMPSLFASLRVVEVDSYLALNIHMVFAAVFIPIIIWILYKSKNNLSSSFIVLAGTFIVTPYSFNYDMGAFSIICGVYVTLLFKKNFLHSLLWMFLAVICGAMVYLKIDSFQLMPLILCSGFLIHCVLHIKNPHYYSNYGKIEN